MFGTDTFFPVFLRKMCGVQNGPVNRDVIRYPALFEVSGIGPASTSLFGQIPDIFKLQENCVL